MKSPKVYTALNAVTATTTSESFYIGDFKRVAFLFRRAVHSAGGSTAFTINTGFDITQNSGTTAPTMTANAMVILNTANDNTKTNYTHGTVTLSANGDGFGWLDPSVSATHVSVTATETANGTHTAYIIGWED